MIGYHDLVLAVLAAKRFGGVKAVAKVVLDSRKEFRAGVACPFCVQDKAPQGARWLCSVCRDPRGQLTPRRARDLLRLKGIE